MKAKVLIIFLLVPQLIQTITITINPEQVNKIKEWSTVFGLPVLVGLGLNAHLKYSEKITELEEILASALLLSSIDAIKSGNPKINNLALKTIANACGLYVINCIHKYRSIKKNKFDEDNLEDELININNDIDSLLSYVGVYTNTTTGTLTKYIIFFDLTKDIISKINSIFLTKYSH